LTELPRYHFDDFILSPTRRVLLRGGNEIPLIPRYFDLLVFLVERRHEAVHRREIFDRVWRDVIVSDSALSQAIRTIRRALDDDPKEPRFIRTVSRHGYRFVFTDIREEEERSAEPPTDVPRADDEAVASAAPVDAEPLRRLDLRPAHTLALARWEGATLGGGLAGLLAGACGGLLLATVPGSEASFAVVPVLALIGAACGGAGGAGVGAGLAAAETAPRSWRTAALVLGGAIGGGTVGTAAQFLGRWSLDALVGVHIDIAGGVEGLAIGAAAALGFGLATTGTEGWLRGPLEGKRLRVAIFTAAVCGVAALLLSLDGRPLVGGTIHAIATHSAGSQAALTSLGRLIGEPDFGPVSRAIIGTGEAMIFGLGVALGLTRRPK
jgi:DNA-binding winged helix-turn-helix (wHTH) protein